jgi:hypothetical protein
MEATQLPPLNEISIYFSLKKQKKVLTKKNPKEQSFFLQDWKFVIVLEKI